MTTQTVRPRGRRPGNDDTRGTIARSALELFDAQGYDATSLRAIARHAQVDPALVHHYYSSKAQLLANVLLDSDLELGPMVDTMVAGDRSGVGLRVARACFAAWEHPIHHESLLSFLRPEHSGRERHRLLGEFLACEVFARVSSALGHRDATLRGQLAATSFLGLLSARHVLQFGALASTSLRRLTHPTAAVLQVYLAEDW